LPHDLQAARHQGLHAEGVTLNRSAGVTLAGQRVMVMPFDGHQARGGATSTGLIGYDFFAAYVVRNRFCSRRPSLHGSPRNSRRRRQAIEVPITFAGSLPVARATSATLVS
jgi:hypothetical protein